MVSQTSLRCAVQGALIAMQFCASQVYATSLPPAARGEIEGLLSRLAASGCQFKRNGSWHTAVEAQAHLRHKLDYLENKGAVASTEQFIERAATQSSMAVVDRLIALLPALCAWPLMPYPDTQVLQFGM